MQRPAGSVACMHLGLVWVCPVPSLHLNAAIRSGSMPAPLRYKSEGRGIDARFFNLPSHFSQATQPLTEISTRDSNKICFWGIEGAGA
jgi:hypothetical protein